MSTKKQDFALEVEAVNGSYKNGFKAVAHIGVEFKELVLRYKLAGGADFNNFKQFGSGGVGITCNVSAAEVKPLLGKKPEFFAVAILAAGDNQKSNAVEVDLS
jgi:hypothetical protein